jgi:hypothetical protein
MVRSIVSTREFSVTIAAMDLNGDDAYSRVVENLSFMQAGDYAEKAVAYFQFEIEQQPNWSSVQIEINNRDACLEMIEINRAVA